MTRALMACVCLVAWACGLPETPRPHDESTPTDVGFSIVGDIDAGRFAPNVQFEFEHLDDARDAKLFEGELSQQQLGAVRKNELTQVLVERQIATLSVHRRLLPQQPLFPYASYTVVYGARAEVVGIAEPGAQRLVSHWPPTPAGAVVLCATNAATAFEPRGEIELYPPGSWARWSALKDDCALLSLRGAQQLDRVALPSKYGRWDIEPTVLRRSGDELRAVAEQCPAESYRLGLGCGQLFDNALLVFPPAVPTLWKFAGDIRCVYWTDRDTPFVIRGLQPLSTYHVTLQVVDATGRIHASEPVLLTPAAAARPVITAVLADPVGSEAEGEWVQLHNSGSLSVNLGAWKLADRAAPVPLGDHELPAQQSVLLVNDAFKPSLPSSQPTTANLIRLPRLTVGGLSNAGEPLRLLDPSDRVVSTFPALASEGAGVSWMRAYPTAPDQREDSFSPGGVSSEVGLVGCDVR